MFGEKKEEYSTKQRTNIPVWKSDKYEESKQKAIEIIGKYKSVNEGDFWILMNETKTGKMMYSGLIISHNGCLKINDSLADGFRPECLKVDKDGYGGSLIYEYCCIEQGLYEVGEVSQSNCKNSYPYAMAFKRCFDRVVLKLSKLAYAGIYSDSEADEFKRPEPTDEKEESQFKDTKIGKNQIAVINGLLEKSGADKAKFFALYGIGSVEEMTDKMYADASMRLSKKMEKNGKTINA